MFFKHTQFAWAIFFIILILTLVPGSQVPSHDGVNADKAIHFTLFLALSFSCLVAFYKQYQFRCIQKNAFTINIVFCLFYGLAIELIQELFLDGRGFEWMDLVANYFGLAVGCLIFLIVKGREKLVE